MTKLGHEKLRLK